MRRLVLALLLAMTLMPTAHAAGDLSGIYLCEGTNAHGEMYRAVVEIRQTAETYHLRWIFTSTTIYGVGVLEKDRLIVASANGQFLTVAVYRVKKGRLQGSWAQFGGGARFTETLIKQPDGITIPERPAHPPPTRPKADANGRERA